MNHPFSFVSFSPFVVEKSVSNATGDPHQKRMKTYLTDLGIYSNWVWDPDLQNLIGYRLNTCRNADTQEILFCSTALVYPFRNLISIFCRF